MAKDSGSLLRRMELGFALGTFLITGLMALFMDRALHRSLEAEDTLVMQAQARSLVLLARDGNLAADGHRLPEKSEWRILAPGGGIRAQSPGFQALGPLDWAIPSEAAVADRNGGGRAVLKLTQPLQDGGRVQMAMDRSHEGALVASFRRTLLLALVAAAALAALAGRWAAQRGLAPLRRIAQEAGDIHPLRLGRRLDPAVYPAELQQLVQTLNGALERIQGAFDQLGRFGGELAHEFRTPLQNLRGEVEGLLRRPAGTATDPEALGSILEECDRLAALVEQTLFLARTEDPSAALAKDPIPVLAFLEGMASFFEASAEEKGVALEVAAPEALLVHADKALLERALANLLSNAIRHTPAGGRVALRGETSAGGCVLSVSDTGPGVEPALSAHLGEPWMKGPGRYGHGLGLAIVKGILKLHGGRVEFRPSAQGGLAVILSFPG